MSNENIQLTASAGARDGQKILRLKGPLNIHTIFDFQTAVRADSSPILIVDFSDVPFVDSTGVGALVAAHLSAKKANRTLVLAGINPQVRALLEMTRVSQFFSTYPTVQDAEAATS